MLDINDIALIIPFHKNKDMLNLSLKTLMNTFQSQIPEILIIAC